MSFPIYQNINDLYENFQNNIENYHQPRIQNLQQKFHQCYQKKSDFIARAPGRVNIIGEHIDYMGYGVLPFALEKDTLIACSLNDQKVLNISCLNNEKFKKVSINCNDSLEQHQNQYYSYIMAGYKSVFNYFNLNEFQGLDLLVTGDVPIASGVSSSSSLVVCSAIMTLQALDKNKDLDKQNFIETVIDFERQLGTAVGGMDQTISALGLSFKQQGQNGKALNIDFNPIKIKEIQLPINSTFIVANSLTESAKLETLGTRYNMRVSECRFAIKLICKKLQINQENIKTLKDIQEYLQKDFDQMVEIINQNLKDEPYTQIEIEQELGIKVETFINDIIQYEKVLEINTHFYVKNRALHVYQEAQRVIQFVDFCKLDSIEKLGQLMMESHQSCDKLYNCSSENLNQLVKLGEQFGAYGRLTGAGWGGCSVFLIDQSKAQEFIENLKKTFYKGKDTDGILFVSKPCQGGCLLILD